MWVLSLDDISTFGILLSAINKRAGRFASASSRHVKKRRHLSAISAQISFVDQETRSNGSSVNTFLLLQFPLFFLDAKLKTGSEMHILFTVVYRTRGSNC